MFVRRRTRTRQGRDGGVVAYYQVLASVRVDGRPTHRVVASWSGHPDLAAALRMQEYRVARAERHLARDQREMAAMPASAVADQLAGRRTRWWALDRAIEKAKRRLAGQRAALAGLREAHAALGDWRDPDPPPGPPPPTPEGMEALAAALRGMRPTTGARQVPAADDLADIGR